MDLKIDELLQVTIENKLTKINPATGQLSSLQCDVCRESMTGATRDGVYLKKSHKHFINVMLTSSYQNVYSLFYCLKCAHEQFTSALENIKRVETELTRADKLIELLTG